MYIFTSHEYYGRVASLMTTSTDGKRDLSPPGNVRYYAVMGGEHVPRVAPDPWPGMRYLPDPLDYTWLERSLLLRLEGWVREGAAPPASRYPRIADATLILPGTQHFPTVRNVATPAPAVVHRTYQYDFGPGFPAAMTYEPPHVGAPYPVLVPATDEDGNDRGGLRLPDVAVPLGTYTGWNLRTAEVGFPSHLVDFFGSFLPFARNDAQRGACGDTRPSITARYGNRAGYLQRYDTAVHALIGNGYLLSEDAAALHARADALWTWSMDRSNGCAAM
jgi:Alpha/beta hydrolase domain